jgi:hypothetical protein
MRMAELVVTAEMVLALVTAETAAVVVTVEIFLR